MERRNNSKTPRLFRGECFANRLLVPLGPSQSDPTNYYKVLTFPHLREGSLRIPRDPQTAPIEVIFELKSPTGNGRWGQGKFTMGFAQAGIGGNSHVI